MTIIVDPAAQSGRTFLDLQDEALSDDFEPDKYRTLTRRFLNEAQRRIARRVRVPQLEQTQTFTTVAGDGTVDLDENVIRINSLRNTTDRDPLDDVGTDALDDFPSASGKPSSYATSGQELTLYPTPDAGYNLEVRYQSRPADLDDDGDVPQMGDDYADLLVTYARARLFRLEDDMELARLWMEDFETDLAKYATDVQLHDRSRVRQVEGMFSGGNRGPSFVRPGG